MTETTTQSRLQHVVLMKFPAELSEQDRDEMFALVHTFPREIGVMSQCRIGADLTGERSRGYHYLLYTVFPGPEALGAYVAHPVHQQLVRFLDARSCERLAFDYYLDATTDAFA